MRITVLGGSGLLGRHLEPLLLAAGHQVTIASRSGPVKADLETGDGLGGAVQDADIVVHLASNAQKPQKVDVNGTRHLLGLLDGQQIVYPSIVGVDHHPFAYYRAKHQVEMMIEESGLPFTIMRATQFHDFVAYLLRPTSRPPIALVPKRFVFQPVDTTEVASELASHIHMHRTGFQPDFAGPEILTAEHLARTLMTAIGRERPMLNLPVPGKSARAFKNGVHTNPDRAVGKRTWADFLADIP